jgi:septal ring factor EnvC (AmiA/AmiB activator)
MKVFTLALVALLVVATLTAIPAAAQSYESARALVQRAQDHLQQARDNDTTKTAKALERIDNAKKHLADLDRHLAKKEWNGDRLNESIDDIKNVIDNNPLLSADRDALSVDLADLRHLRETKK